ncbi:XylR family transcriptional regulator [Terriglobus roseus]|uniref:LacI family transcriptional regulator n=1 Tax=Terriglobus roseus TaxID=392734 RepID=A0A1H4K7K4_9BACT|nr:DNA-binding transcriptional regulator [Terriglobus roseus]SEB54501.1 LacI family transcriptional regulator [Terriglobus roseus]
MGRSSNPPRVALVVETSTQFGRTLLSGIAQYVRECGPWTVMFTERAVNDRSPSWLREWDGDGIITRVASPDIREIVASKRIPTIDLNEQTADMGIPQIANDHGSVGKLAADHLLERRFIHFAFVGHAGHPWSDERATAFAATVEAKGFSCAVYGHRELGMAALREGAWNTELDQLTEWIKGLPKPVGIMASTDFRGLQVLTACRMAGLAVPIEAAVIGVGADDIACALSDPPLSSVELGAWQMGYEAARLLDSMISGERVPQNYVRRMPPAGVVVRRSTDGVAIYDPSVAKAARYIRQHALNGIRVPDVLSHVGVSRTTLQDRFNRELGESIHDLIAKAKLDRVRELLVETNLSIAEIAVRCGFRHVEYMTEMMRQRTGQTPGSYRAQHSVLTTRRH